MESWSTLAGTILAVLIVSYTAASSRTQRCMPPGPKGWPVFGNAFQIPTKLPFLQFDEWAKRYGPIVSLNAMGQRIVVLNDFKSVMDLFGVYRVPCVYSKSTLYSLYRGKLTAENDSSRKMRRAIHEGFNPRTIITYRGVQERSAPSLGLKLIEDPDRWTSHIMQYDLIGREA
ncbi:hypothetical protein EIP86_001586 [Pleurotus ostreatoroseus]|nr:hypothetical protein EIP86_001586 [Pleurotus ostreatoroseus]